MNHKFVSVSISAIFAILILLAMASVFPAVKSTPKNSNIDVIFPPDATDVEWHGEYHATFRWKGVKWLYHKSSMNGSAVGGITAFPETVK